MMSKSPMPGAAAIPTPPAGPVDLTAARSAVDELDGLCQKAKQAAASGDTQPMARYASFCDKRVDQLRSRISIVEQSGDERQAQTLTGNVQRTLEMARRIASRPAPQEPVKN